MNRSLLPRVNGRVAAGTCEACGFVNATTTGDTMTCAGCSARVRLTYVTGNLNAAQPCDARCQYARGPNCSCACGGDNHRAGYINPGLVPVWVRDRDRERHDAKATREAAKVAARQQRAEDGRAAILAEHPELVDLLGDRYAPGTYTSDFMVDMRAALLAGDMTPRQVAAASGAVLRDRDRTARWSVWDAAHEAAQAAGRRITPGRRTITGTVIRLVEELNTFTYHESHVLKVTIQDDDGLRFTGTLPRDLEPEWSGQWSSEYEGWTKRAPGQRLSVTATVKDPRANPCRAYFSHPRAPKDAARLMAQPTTEPTQQPPAPAPAPAADTWAALFASV